jgi:ribosome-associated toxin RatA of RatAB toxin-antitoxin module
MGVSVDIALGYEFAVKAPFSEVFDLLADVPASVGFFPHVDRLVDMGDGVYRWEMANLGTQQAVLRTVYASRYVSNRRKGSVVWTPVVGVGNARVSGSWKIERRKTSTALTLKLEGTVETPLPALMEVLIVPVVRGEFERLVETYIDNLIERFGGEVE